jgi:chlorobactene glucosyltransferase
VEITFFIILFINLIIFGIVIYNFFTAPKLQIKEGIKNQKLVSVLIPARNEEKNIQDLLLSTINQTYENIEIIVADDQSTDNTKELVYEIMRLYPEKNIRLYENDYLPKGWNGKCWACHNLSLEAHGDFLLFIDADVKLNKYAIESAVYELEKRKIDILTVFPTQITNTLSEKIFVGAFMDWTLISLLPIKLSNNMFNKDLVAVNGQFLLFSKNAYDSIGGHISVKGSVVEDYSFGVIAKENKLKLHTFLGDKLIYCRMYKNFNECVKGFTKNYYILSRTRNVFAFIILNLLFVFAFLLPFILSFVFYPFAIVVLTIVAQRIFEAKTRNKSSILNILLHPFQMIVFLLVAPKSYFSFTKKQIEWSGRQYAHIESI